jgi:hypothetical protein
MKNLYLFLFILFFSFTGTYGQVIVSEDFDYADGTTLGGANGGTGWGDAWKSVGNSERTVIADTIRNFRTGKASGSFLQFTLVDSTENLRYQRALPNPITDDGNEYWLGFNLEVLEAGGNVTNLVLVDTAGSAFKLVIGRIFNGNIALGPPGQFVQSNATTPLQANWYVAKISYSGDEAADTVRLFLNPDPDVMPSDEDAFLTYTGTGLNDQTINGIFIRAEANPRCISNFDDIYMGSSYTDILPTTAVDIAKYLPVRESFEYPAGADVAGNGDASGGWGGPWEQTGGVAQNVVSDSIVNNALLFNTGGNSLLMDATLGATRLTRPLSQTYEDNGLTYWLSFNIDFEDAVDAGVVNVMLINNDSETMGAGGPGGQFLGIGKSNDSLAVGVMSYGPFDFTQKIPNAAVGGHWMVARVEMSGDETPDTVRFYLNPDPTVEPQVGDEDLKFVAQELNGGFKAIGIKHDAGSTKSKIDDIYLAIDFEDVVPNDLEAFVLPEVAFEKFDYAAEDSLDAQGAAENGWAGPWTLLSGANQPIVEGGIQNSTLLRQTSGNSLFLDANNGATRFKRELATPYRDNGSTYWFAFHAEFEDADQDNGEVVVMLVDNNQEDFGAGGGAGQFIGIGKTDTPGALGIFSFQPFGKVQVADVADNAVWLVAKIETNGTDARDSVRLYINPDPGQEPAPGSEAVVYAAPELNGGFQGIGFKQSAGATQTKIDDIYVGNFFSDVVPDDLAPVAFPDPAFEKFEYAVGDSLETKGEAVDGWAGPWEKLSGSAGATISDTRLINTDLFVRSAGNSLLLDAIDGDLRYVRPLSSDYNDNGLTYWFGFQAQFEGTSADGGVVNIMLVNNDQETFGAGGGAGQFVAIGKSNAPGTLGVLRYGGFEKVDVPDVNADGTFWLVARIETNGTEAADTVRLYINPSPTGTPAPGTEVAVFTANELNGGFRGIGFKQDPGATKTLIDDIYLGNSFAEIVPPDLEDITDLYTAGETYEPFNYSVGENLDGQGERESGWGGPWVQTAGDDITIEEGSIETDFAVFEANKAYANYTTDVMQYDRELSARFEDDGSSVWLSFLMDVRNASSIFAESKIALMDGENEVVGFGRVGGVNLLGVTTDPVPAVSQVASEGEAWVVARIDFSNDDQAETIRVWLNSETPEVQPGDDFADILIEADDNNAVALNNGFDGIRITGAGMAGVEFVVDEIRLGFNYADVSKKEEVLPPNLIAREQFKYPADQPIEGLGAEGTQWGGPWALIEGGDGLAITREGSLDYTEFMEDGNKLELTNTEGAELHRFARPLAQKVTDDGNSYWFAYLSQYDNSVDSRSVTQGIFYNLDDFEGRNPPMRLLFGRKFNANVNTLFDINGQVTVEAPVAAEITSLLWTVVKVEFSGDESEDNVYLWYNPAIGDTTDLDVSTANASLATTVLNQGITALGFRCEGPGQSTLFVDEVHWGTTFKSIVPGAGAGDVTNTTTVSPTIGSIFVYPNPANNFVNFDLNVKTSGNYSLRVFNLSGQHVATPFQGRIGEGEYRVTWDLEGRDDSKISRGFYFYQLTDGVHQVTGKLVIND